MNYSIEVDYDYDFELTGIISPLKEYSLAWHIEKKLGIEFQDKKEFPINLLKGYILFSSYLYEEDYGFIRIIKNKSWENENNPPYLIPEMKQFDYFLLSDGEVNDLDINSLTSKIKQISNVLFMQKIEVQNLKSKENLIF